MKKRILAALLTTVLFTGHSMASGLKEYKVEYVVAGSGVVYAENIYAHSSTEAWNKLKKKEKNNGKEAIQRSVRELKQR
ncbi:hypothetical protein KGP17_11865 [Serratia sp. JSRIV001]|uniref:hypothetical protein n=1 Tax=Serratia sp. JSRIV001 TaxID=2831893 RepID=UPI001CBC4D45|nr:hypothetical protein [Serratia sp. JSRIV001]UAN48167.1 hypothetical protein KGP17_11865 [Serratia sp. JSRIV001]